MDYPKWMLDAIRCPETKEPLQIKEDHLLRADGLEYPIIDGPEGWKKRLLTRVNPGFLKPIPIVPGGTTDVAEYEVYGGFAYLEVAIKG